MAERIAPSLVSSAMTSFHLCFKRGTAAARGRGGSLSRALFHFGCRLPLAVVLFENARKRPERGACGISHCCDRLIECAKTMPAIEKFRWRGISRDSLAP